MKLFLSISLAIALLFLASPELDIWLHQFFYRAGEGFFLKKLPLFTFIYHAVRYTVYVLIVVFVALLAIHLCFRKQWGIFGRREVVFLALTLALGPGLLVNTIIKDNWGRARPSQIVEFGGTKQFTPPFIITDQCEKNCSFVSGHASVGFYFVAFAFLFPAYRRRILIASTVAGIGIGIVRMAQGGHFASDVIFSGVFVYLMTCLLYEVLYMKRGNKLEPLPDSLEN